MIAAIFAKNTPDIPVDRGYKSVTTRNYPLYNPDPESLAFGPRDLRANIYVEYGYTVVIAVFEPKKSQ